MVRVADLCAALVAFATLSSCEGTPVVAGATAAAAGSYVGSARDLDGPVSMGLAVQDQQLALFVCSDDPASHDYPGWLPSGTTTADGRIRVEHEGWSFVGSFEAGGAEGTLTAPTGATVRWAGRPVTGTTLSGLYSAFDSGCMTGVVVVDNGPTAPPTVRGQWCSADGQVSQVIVAGSPVRLFDGRLPVEVPLATGVRRLDVAPVQLPLPN